MTSEIKTHLSHGKLIWASDDKAVFEVSTEKTAPSEPETALNHLLKRKAEIERAKHVSTFKAGADRELAAIDELLKTLNDCVPQAA